MTHALLITADETLLDELVRLCAAAGTTPDVAADVGAALRGWSSAALVLLGADLAPEVARAAPPRRDGVHVVAWGSAPDALFRTALAVGAEGVALLPGSAEWLAAVLGDVGDVGRARGLTIGLMAGSGGAGATTFACALAQLAARGGPTVVIDADPLGPGADRVLGLEERPGVRWGELARTAGRLSARSLREGLPRYADLAVLTWATGDPRDLDVATVREVLSAARRGHDTVVVDLPRAGDPVTDDLVNRCDQVLLVVTASVTGIASAARLVARFGDRSRLRLVVRGGGAEPEAVARAVGVPLIAAMGDQRGLAEAIDLGLGPVRSRRGPLGRAAQTVLGLMPAAA
ncbi:septum site-determining protein Ssd [Nocardioides sp. CER19]|uniref:septum site-determining protein Ssd n=1 Tax=Nocardioides sp. CER19 TaxID=3038538 RepID=UPI00244C1CF6|nr:septum site-determining protein Ssd [Nocardioides sp. CER19]MDH2412590.1 CpaE-like family protein [Nocardioides sp. CER19]